MTTPVVKRIPLGYLVEFSHGKSIIPPKELPKIPDTLPKPRPAYGENGEVKPRPQLGDATGGADGVPMRVGIDYTYAEAYGLAEVGYLFEVGKTVLLATGGACRIEQLTPGMRFQLKRGGLGTVTKVDPPIPWPVLNQVSDEHGRVVRRILGKVKHIGYMVVDVVVGGQTITTTPDHRFKLGRGAWVPAAELRRGDTLVGSDKRPVSVESVSAPHRGLIELYNLEVEIDHNFFVQGKATGRNPVSGILVHNGLDCINLPAEVKETTSAAAAGSHMYYVATAGENTGSRTNGNGLAAQNPSEFQGGGKGGPVRPLRQDRTGVGNMAYTPVPHVSSETIANMMFYLNDTELGRQALKMIHENHVKVIIMQAMATIERNRPTSDSRWGPWKELGNWTGWTVAHNGQVFIFLNNADAFRLAETLVHEATHVPAADRQNEFKAYTNEALWYLDSTNKPWGDINPDSEWLIDPSTRRVSLEAIGRLVHSQAYNSEFNPNLNDYRRDFHNPIWNSHDSPYFFGYWFQEIEFQILRPGT